MPSTRLDNPRIGRSGGMLNRCPDMPGAKLAARAAAGPDAIRVLVADVR
jgi:hypothetical protein